MKIVVLGAAGMFGHKCVQLLRGQHQVVAVIRSRPALFPFEVYDGVEVIDGVDVADFNKLEQLLKQQKPDVVVNGIGIIKQRDEALEAVVSIKINSLLPHILADICETIGAYFVTLGTDCVFSCDGRGEYTEDSPSNPTDLYGRSKLLGEVDRPNCLTLRMSIIGRELSDNKRSLFEWVYANQGKVINGYSKALYSGLSTTEISKIIAYILDRKERLSGIFHVAGPYITKYDLVMKINDIFGLGMTIKPYDDFVCDRRLNSNRFIETTGYKIPSWDKMLKDMLEQNQLYCY
jgi:dTDP-4-dehydrorhamnose reductase